MQNARSNIEVTTSNPEHILMFGALVMHTHLVGAQPHQRKLTGPVVHRVPPPTYSHAKCRSRT